MRMISYVIAFEWSSASNYQHDNSTIRSKRRERIEEKLLIFFLEYILRQTGIDPNMLSAIKTIDILKTIVWIA